MGLCEFQQVDRRLSFFAQLRDLHHFRHVVVLSHPLAHESSQPDLLERSHVVRCLTTQIRRQHALVDDILDRSLVGVGTVSERSIHVLQAGELRLWQIHFQRRGELIDQKLRELLGMCGVELLLLVRHHAIDLGLVVLEHFQQSIDQFVIVVEYLSRIVGQILGESVAPNSDPFREHDAALLDHGSEVRLGCRIHSIGTQTEVHVGLVTEVLFQTIVRRRVLHVLGLKVKRRRRHLGMAFERDLDTGARDPVCQIHHPVQTMGEELLSGLGDEMLGFLQGSRRIVIPWIQLDIHMRGLDGALNPSHGLREQHQSPQAGDVGQVIQIGLPDPVVMVLEREVGHVLRRHIDQSSELCFQGPDQHDAHDVHVATDAQFTTILPIGQTLKKVLLDDVCVDFCRILDRGLLVLSSQVLSSLLCQETTKGAVALVRRHHTSHTGGVVKRATQSDEVSIRIHRDHVPDVFLRRARHMDRYSSFTGDVNHHRATDALPAEIVLRRNGQERLVLTHTVAVEQLFHLLFRHLPFSLLSFEEFVALRGKGHRSLVKACAYGFADRADRDSVHQFLELQKVVVVSDLDQTFKCFSNRFILVVNGRTDASASIHNGL